MNPQTLKQVAIFVSMVLVACVALTIAAPCQSQADPLTIVYTGKLFGYYRIAPGNSPTLLGPVQRFIASWNATKDASPGFRPLLLGMGDNFGPEFGASLQLENDKDEDCKQPANSLSSERKEIVYPQSLYKRAERTPKQADCDNVVRFMTTLGYRAIVPGKEDLLYSPWWLNRIADSLRVRNAELQNGKLPSNPPGTHVDAGESLTLLAANLRMKVAVEKQAELGYKKTLPKGLCPLLLDSQLLNESRFDQMETCSDDKVPELIDRLFAADRDLKDWKELKNVIEQGKNGMQKQQLMSMERTLLANETRNHVSSRSCSSAIWCRSTSRFSAVWTRDR